MLEGESRQDSLFEMMDKLHVMNLSMEGAAILKSMADSIRAALENGLLLEQLILNERNNSVQEPQKSKKRKRKQSLCSNESITVNYERESLPVIDIKDEARPECSFDQSESLKHAVEQYVNKTKPLNGRVKIIKDVNPKKYVITLKDPASLVISNPNSRKNDNKSSRTHNKQNRPIKKTKPIVQDHFSREKHPNLVTTLALHSETDHSKYPNITPETALLTSVNSYTGTIAETQQEPITRSIADVPPLLNTSVSNDSTMKTTCFTPINKLPDNNEGHPLSMPPPIKIKSELQKSPQGNNHPLTDMFIPFNVMNTTQPNQTPLDQIAETQVTTNAVSDTAKIDESRNHDQHSEYQVYIEGINDLKEEEILSILKDLDVIHCRILNRINYSFGFIKFSSIKDRNKALALNNKFFIRGKAVFIRKCHENRKKIQNQPKLTKREKKQLKKVAKNKSKSKKKTQRKNQC